MSMYQVSDNDFDMLATVSLVDSTGMSVFHYGANLDEVNEDTGDRVWDSMTLDDKYVEMCDRAAEQARILFPEHEVLAVKVDL